MTSRIALTDATWVDLGLAPCFLQSVRFGPLNIPGDVAFVIDGLPPVGLNVPAHELTHGNLTADVGLDGQHVYARALDSRGAVLSVSR